MELKKEGAEPEMAELPEGWKTLEDGTPAPNWVAAIDEARRDIGFPLPRKSKGSGACRDVAPGISPTVESIADRRAEVRKDPWIDSDPQPGDFDEELGRSRGDQIELHEGNPDATLSKLDSDEDDA